MGVVLLPVRRVSLSQRRVSDHHHIFRVPLLGGVGELERTRDDRVAIDDHHVVIRDGMGGVNPDGDTGLRQQRRLNVSD